MYEIQLQWYRLENDQKKKNLSLPSSKYSLWYIELPVISALVENFSASDSSGSIAPIWMKMSNSPLRAFQSDFVRCVFEIPGPIIITTTVIKTFFKVPDLQLLPFENRQSCVYETKVPTSDGYSTIWR